MTTPTNWPNPERPGYPPNPERDGMYAMRIDEKFIVRFWSAAQQHYSLVPGWKNGISPSDASVFTFCGEILTPAQIAELLAGERDRCANIFQAKAEGKRKILPDLQKERNALKAVQLDITYLEKYAEEIRNLGAAP